MVSKAGDTVPPRETITPDQLRRIGRPLLDRRDRLSWAVACAQLHVDELTPGRELDLRAELAAFLVLGVGLPAGGVDVPLPTRAELVVTQGEFRTVLGAVVRGTPMSIGVYRIQLILTAGVSRASIRERIDRGYLPEQACYALARVLLELDHDYAVAGHSGPIVKVCHAPQSRAKGEEHCGRWFVGRPNQVYCSSQCQNRAATRATRARAKKHEEVRASSKKPSRPRRKGGSA